VRFADFLTLAFSALWCQKVRTILTTLGVVFGSFVLAASLSIRQGVHETIVRQYRKFGELRQIDVHPTYESRAEPPAEKLDVRGNMSEAKRERLRKEISRRWRAQGKPDPRNLLTSERVAAMAALEHVRAVEPVVRQDAYVTLGNKSERVLAIGAHPEKEELRRRLVAGGFLDAADGHGVLVSEYLLYELGVADDADVEQALGQRLRLEQRSGASPNLLVLLMRGRSAQQRLSAEEEKLLSRILQRLPDTLGAFDLTPEEQAAARKLLQPPARPERSEQVEEFTIRGVFRAAATDEGTQHRRWESVDADLIMPSQTAAELFDRLTRNREYGYPVVRVEVDDLTHVKQVAKQIEAMGLTTYSLAEAIEKEQFTYFVIFSAMTVVAVVALAVAALGITNTMLMGVLERVREIGIMKAVGARDGHIQMMFMVEGAVVGVLGGCIGLLLGWAGHFPADAWVKDMVERQVSVKLEDSVFAFPVWLLIGVPVFAGIVTTLAAFYPARRAARVNPIAALRHD
jgi:putative ABC transport system permease protein